MGIKIWRSGFGDWEFGIRIINLGSGSRVGNGIGDQEVRLGFGVWD